MLKLANTFAQTLCAQCCVPRSKVPRIIIITVIISIISTTIKAVKHTVFIVQIILTYVIVQKSINDMTRVRSNALTFRTVLGIDTSSTAIPSIKVTVLNICLIIAKAISYSCICDFVSCSRFAFAFCAEFSIDTGPTAVPSIKRTMAIIVVILAKTIANQCSELAVYILGVKRICLNVFVCIEF